MTIYEEENLRKTEITISCYTYNELINIRNKYDKLIEIIFDKVRLNYNKDSLLFDDKIDFIKYFEKIEYESKMKELKNEEGENNEL